ncbi:MAG: hypothetical protein SVP26_00735 [Chloroflexota bacterium]|nr:hypothetical protein [Chloroflexota bacterium]
MLGAVCRLSIALEKTSQHGLLRPLRLFDRVMPGLEECLNAFRRYPGVTADHAAVSCTAADCRMCPLRAC